MKGVIYNAVEDAAGRAFRDDGWDDTIGRAEVDGSYTSLGNFDDEELAAIVGALPDGPAVRSLNVCGGWGSTVSRSSWRPFPTSSTRSLKDFLPALNHMIHPEVRKLYPGATPPDFDISPIGDQIISMQYDPDHELCFLAEGLKIGVTPHLGRTLHIDQLSCTHDGDPHCELRIHLTA